MQRITMDDSSKKGFTIATNVLAWLAFVTVFLLFELNAPEGRSFHISGFLLLLALIFQYYSFYFFFTPKFFLKRKYLWFGLSVIGCLVLVAFFSEFAVEQIKPERLDQLRGQGELRRPMRPRNVLNPMHFVVVLLSGITILISVIARTASHLASQDKRRKESENKQLATELNMLKNQVSPHFFFNTLNTIYALTNTNPEKAGEVVHQLSKMMRYLLYETEKTPTVDISKEVEFMETYLQLMQARLTENVEVKFDVKLENEQFKVPALLFIPLVENAFKHGVSTVKPSYVHLKLTTEKDVLSLDIKNSIHANLSSLEKGGIGLVNVKRRLALMYEPTEYKLDITQDETEYKLTLTIKKCL
jgi:two-component system LytT family sensor kinase